MKQVYYWWGLGIGLFLFLVLTGVKTIMNSLQEQSNFQQYQPIADKWADYYGIPRTLVYAHIKVESDWDPNSYNGNDPGGGAFGLGQILFTTAQGEGFGGMPDQLFDPDTNLHYAVKLMHQNYVSSNGNINDTICRYNSGRPEATAPSSTVNQYLPAVLKYMDEYGGIA